MAITYVRGGIETKEHLRNKMAEKGRESDAALDRKRKDREDKHEALRKERHAVLRKRGVLGRKYY